MHSSLYLILLGGGLALTSCIKDIPTPTSAAPKVTKPITWIEAGKGQNGKISKGWVNEFNSPRLTSLVNEAVKNNPSLKATEARLRASWSSTQASYANLSPTLNVSATGNRRVSGNAENPTTYNTNLGLNLNASWEPDLWGRLKDRTEASLASYRSSAQDYRAAQLSLAANTAKAWCNLITAQQQLDLATHTLQSFEKNRRIVERNYKAGVPGTRSLAVQLSRSNVASAKGTLRNRQLQRNNAARALESLLGRYPKAEIDAAPTLPTIKKHVPAGLPAQLLNRRPDILAAQQDIINSAKNADISRKDLLPSIRLTSGLSNGSGELRELLDIQRLSFNIASSISQSIYDDGERKLNAQATLDRNKAAIYSYSNVVLRAFREVEDALGEDRALRQQEKFLLEETKSSALAEKQAERDYSEGIEGVGILEVLESQRRANNARSSLINIRNRRLQNRIDLHLALGGDFFTTN